ncbi:MAG: hypothetical protein QNJ54_22105 [Prochloraceae cyanobacterium]|nr:hypothetical protein [Prochloraceae cyanobacterium]
MINIQVIEENLRYIQSNSEKFCKIFYQLLEEENNELMRLFRHKTTNYKYKQLMNWLTFVFNKVRQSSYSLVLLKHIGGKNIELGITFKHYQIVSDTLLRSVACYLQDKWTTEVARAWREFSEISMDIMLEGGKEQYSLWNGSSLQIIRDVNRMRIEAITQKVLDAHNSLEVIMDKLMEDKYFQKAEYYMGREKAIEIVFDLVKKTKAKKIALIGA